MKKILISVFALALAAPAFAQLEKGQFTVGGSLDVSAFDGGHSFLIAPELGYMLQDNLQLGLGLGFGNVKNSAFSGLEGLGSAEKETFISAELFGRYFWSIADKASFALRGGVGYGNFTESKLGMFGVNVAPEFWFNITPATSITASVGSLGYNMLMPDGGDNEGVFNLNWNTVSLGVNFAF